MATKPFHILFTVQTGTLHTKSRLWSERDWKLNHWLPAIYHLHIVCLDRTWCSPCFPILLLCFPLILLKCPLVHLSSQIPVWSQWAFIKTHCHAWIKFPCHTSTAQYILLCMCIIYYYQFTVNYHKTEIMPVMVSIFIQLKLSIWLKNQLKLSIWLLLANLATYSGQNRKATIHWN